MSNVITVTVENRAQASTLHSLNSAAHLLDAALERLQASALQDLESLRAGWKPFGGTDSAARDVTEYRTQVSTLLSIAGSLGLDDEQVKSALTNDYIEIKRLDRD